MQKLSRITSATLDVLRVMVAVDFDARLYGWAIAHYSGRPPGSVYVILARLESAAWVCSEWEYQGTQSVGKPRRKFYWMTEDGRSAARDILVERCIITAGDGPRETEG